MQKPFTIAVVGKGRSRSFCIVSQPSLVNATASSTVAKRVNSLMSAPAMKFSFAERTTRPLGPAAALASSAAPSSSSASREKVLVDSPCLSNVSQARPWRSLSQRQCLSIVFASARSIGRPLEGFDQHRAAQAAADADRGDAALRFLARERLQEVQHDPRARSEEHTSEL